MLRQVLVACAAGLSLTVALNASAATVPPAKLETYLSYPFISGLKASPSGTRLAWIENRQGVRNIWTAETPDFQPRRLTSGTADDGMELGELSLSPDGKIVAWSRGGGESNSWGAGLPPPNPASAVDQSHKEIWVSIAGAAPVRAAPDGEEPMLSATGQLAYLKDGQVWTADLTAKAPPRRLFYDRGRAAQLAWSPDGGRLAFVSRRGDHSFIGIYSGPDHPLTWLSPATAFDANPTWSPDGQRLAFSRQPGRAEPLTSPLHETANPFELWVGSPTDGAAHAIWRSPADLNGSYPEVPDGLFLLWGAGDRLIFRAEMDGWPHLYSLSASGGTATLLTPGPFMVEHVAMTPDRRALLFSANAGAADEDIDRRHLFKVAVDRPGLTPLTAGTGLEWTPAALTEGRIAYIASTPTTVMAVNLAGADGRGAKALDIAGPAYATGILTAPKALPFTAADGQPLHGQLFLPPNGGAKHPAVVFVHGGPSRQMLLGWSYMDYYANAYAVNQYLASRGFVVLSVNYRLGIGYGRAFQHPEKGGRAGDAEYQDVLAAARLLQQLPQVDPTRLGIWGGSYGAG
nr:prolyl oligopeptidase family serine peptidase [Phenylobacterium sp.]